MQCRQQAGLHAGAAIAASPTRRRAKPVPVIVNTTAGADKPQEWLATLQAKCRERGLDAQVLQIDGGERLAGRGRRDAVQAGRAAGDRRRRRRHGERGGFAPGRHRHRAGRACRWALSTISPRTSAFRWNWTRRSRPCARAAKCRSTSARSTASIFLNNSSLGLYPDIVLRPRATAPPPGPRQVARAAAAPLHAARRYPVLSVRIGVNGEQAGAAQRLRLHRQQRVQNGRASRSASARGSPAAC